MTTATSIALFVGVIAVCLVLTSLTSSDSWAPKGMKEWAARIAPKLEVGLGGVAFLPLAYVAWQQGDRITAMSMAALTPLSVAVLLVPKKSLMARLCAVIGVLGCGVVVASLAWNAWRDGYLAAVLVGAGIIAAVAGFRFLAPRLEDWSNSRRRRSARPVAGGPKPLHSLNQTGAPDS